MNRSGVPSGWRALTGSTITSHAPDGSTDTGVPHACWVSTFPLPWPLTTGGSSAVEVGDGGVRLSVIGGVHTLQKWLSGPPYWELAVNASGIKFLYVRLIYTGGDGLGADPGRIFAFHDDGSVPPAGQKKTFSMEVPNATIVYIEHWFGNYFGQGVGYGAAWAPVSGIPTGSKANDAAPTSDPSFDPAVQAYGASRIEGRSTGDLELDTYTAGRKIVVKRPLNLDLQPLQVGGVEIIADDGSVDGSKVVGLTAAQIPNLDAAKIASGRFANDRMPTDPVFTSVTGKVKCRSFNQAARPALDSGEIAWWYCAAGGSFPGEDGVLFNDGANYWWIAGPQNGAATVRFNP